MPNSKKTVARRALFALLVALSVLIGGGWFYSKPAVAATGINQRINFQGRLLTSQGATVPDGYYNLQFKVYQDGDGQTAGNTTGTPAGSLKWTESYLNANGKGVLVRNGYMSVELGSITPFGSSVDWNQDTLWLSINVGNTNTSCTPFTSCGPDGEMLPMRRFSSTPYALNSGMLGGLTGSQFVQLSQGVQTDSANNSNSIYLNKTGTGGNFLTLQNGGADAFSVSNTGNITMGSTTNHSIAVATSGAALNGSALTIAAGNGGSGTGTAGGALVLQGGSGGGTNGSGGSVTLDAGAATGSGTKGSVNIGTTNAGTIQIGSTALGSGTQSIYIGNNSGAGTTNVVLGSAAGATAGSTTVQAKDTITIATNGVTRATFGPNDTLYLGNGVSAAAPNNFTISGTASTTAGVAGANLSLQGGSATTGNTNGGNLLLSGGTASGTGANGLVVMTTPTFSTTTNDPNCYTGGAAVATSCTVAASSVNNSSAILIGFSQNGQTATLPDPTIATAGRVVYVTAANGSNDFTLSVNGGGQGNQIAMRQNTTATMIWNGNDWTAAGASSSTTLQSAYDNTLQSAGGAELIVSKTSTTNGLTIRDSSSSPVNGTLLSVQTSSAAGLFSVNSNVTEYVSNAGAETAGSSASTFPASTWSAINGSTVSRYTTAGNNIATGQGSVSVATSTTAGSGVKNQLSTALTASTTYNVSFAARLSSGTFTDLQVYYSVDGTATSVLCASSKAVPISIWTKINCTFTAPTSGITASNALLIRQTGAGTARTFYVDNASVTIAADYNYATDSMVNDVTNFGTNWTAYGGSTVTRTTATGNDASDSAQVVTTAANQGVRNKLAVNPLPNTLYRVTVYADVLSGTMSPFTIRYSRDGGTNFVGCADYNTQTIDSGTSTFTKVTCYITTDGTVPTSPYVYFGQTDATARTFYIDTFSMALSSNSTPNVQIGGGINGGPTTLLTLDKGASAPIAGDNEALLGSMYYDTTLGKLQCYEADGWGACGSSPDNIVTISPEYTNAVLHGTGVGTMTSDLCSDALDINDGTSGQSSICGTNETYNFYKWTSPQPTAQNYGIYVTYQLPTTFKSFASGQTSIMGRTDSTNSSVTYQIYRNSTSGLTPCGSAVAISSGVQTTWKVGQATGASDPTTCGFTPGDSIVFKINVTASSNANAYVGNLNFTFSNR